MLSRSQLLRSQLKAFGIILLLASLLGIAEGVVASYENFWRIPTDLFAIYNFIVLGIGGVFLTRAVLFNVDLVPNFVLRGRRFLSGAKTGLIRTLANAAIFPIILDTWSQALQVLYARPAITPPLYDVVTGIFPRYPWEMKRYGDWGWTFGRPWPPFNFPFWYYIWIAAIVAYFVIDLARLYGLDLGRFQERVALRVFPRRIHPRVAVSRLGRIYRYFRGYAKQTFKISA